MNKISRIKRYFAFFIINHFLSGTHFFGLKRILLNFGNISCGKNSKIVGPIYVGGVSKLSIGENVWVGRNFSLLGNGEVVIRNNIDIAPDVDFVTGSHEIVENSLKRAGKGVSYKITIEDGCWIGVRSTILGNTTVGSGSIVGACSLVNKTLKSDCVYVGVPAKPIKQLK